MRDGDAELAALVGIGQCSIKGGLHEAEGSCGEDKALEVETLHEDADAAVEGAEDVFRGHEDVGEDEFARVGAAHAELVEFLCDVEARGGGVEDKGCDAFGGGGGLCFGVDDDGVRVWALCFLLAYSKYIVFDSIGKSHTFVIHIFVPLSKYPPSTSVAVAFILTTSLPAECSLIANAPIFSPLISPGRNFFFCASLPFSIS